MTAFGAFYTFFVLIGALMAMTVPFFIWGIYRRTCEIERVLKILAQSVAGQGPSTEETAAPIAQRDLLRSPEGKSDTMAVIVVVVVVAIAVVMLTISYQM